MIRRLLCALAGCALAGTMLIASCGGDDEPEPTPGPNCAPDMEVCPAISVDCLALVDYSGQSQFTLRLSQLAVTQPPVLAQEVMYNIIGLGVNINLPECNISGNGTFCWLLQFDTTTDTLKTGGALPKEDPTEGYCFQYDPPNDIAPIEIAANLQADGSFTGGPIDYISVPIYLDMQASDMVRLPLHDVTFTGTVSADHNCIGKFNWDKLQPQNNCKPDFEEDPPIEYFDWGAELEGFISLEEADTVIVETLNQSLCVVLSGSPNNYGDGGDPIRCSRDGTSQIEFKGDYCSTTKSAGGCQDAVWLAGRLAASAVELRSDCPSGGGGSGGTGGAGGSAGGTGGAAGGVGGAGGA